MRSIQRDSNPILSILLLLLFSLVGMLLFMLLGGLILYLATDATSINAALSGTHTTSEGLMSIRLLQIFQTIGIFIFPAILAALLSSSSTRNFLGLHPTKFSFCIYSMLIMVLAIPGINLIASLNAQIPLPHWMISMEKQATEITEALLMVGSVRLLIINLFMVAVLPAIGEELFFRGSLQPLISRWVKSSFWGILITSALFSAIHFQFQGFIPRMLLGMMLGYLYLWSGSVWLPILAHFVNNTLAVVFYFFITKGHALPNIEKIGEINYFWYLGVASLVVAGAFLLLFHKAAKQGLNIDSQKPAIK